MNRVLTLVLPVVVLAAGSSVARADDKDDAISNLVGALGDAMRWDGPTHTGGDEIHDVITACHEAIADAKKAGVKDGDTITAWSGFEVNPAAKLDGKKVTFKFADAGWYCEDLTKRTQHWDLIGQIKTAQTMQPKIASGLDADETREASLDMVKAFRDYQKRCNDGLAAEQAKGTKSIDLDKSGKSSVAIGDVQALCDVLGKYADLEQAAWDEKVKTLGAKYSAVGIKGDRLELFVYYDDLEGWYLPGCKKSTKDPKAMKKAKALFQWLTDENTGVITVRKFAFKGDAYTLTDKQFDSKSKAYKGCR